MPKKMVFWIGWALILLGAIGHVWHKWLRHDAPGATWFTGEQGSVSDYVREHAIWWGMVFLGAIVVLVNSQMTRNKEN